MTIEGEEGDAPVVENEQTAIVEGEPEAIVAEPVAQDPEPKPAKKPQDPLISEITKLRALNREREAALEAARKEAADAKALAERLAKGEGGEEGKKAAYAPPQSLDDAEIERKVDYKLFLREVADMRQQGVAAFGEAEFGGVIQSLTAYGADNDEFIKAVMAVDRPNAHELLRSIAEDPARAIGLVNMTPTQRIAELTRMSIASKSKPEPRGDDKPASQRVVSNAPKPAPAISSSAKNTVDWRSDKASDAEFDAGFWATWEKRRARR